MRTTFEVDGVIVLILEKAVKLGLVRSKTEALRMGVFALNDHYHLVNNIEMELVARKLEEEEKEMKEKKQRYLSKKEALAKYW